MKPENNAVAKHLFTFAGAVHSVYHCLANQGLSKHDHAYAHITVCHAGSIRVIKEGKEVVLKPTSTPVFLTAGEWHEIEALEDGTVFENIFAEGKQ